jgi:8-oxo-dGTP pyrophosphatase MutT (NUDIX family)
MTKPETSQVLYRGRLIELVREEVPHPDGVRVFEFARRGPGTRILLVSPERGVLLTREYRRELGKYDTRIPGGKVFDTLAEYETGRSSGTPVSAFAEEAAARELTEETGYHALSLDFLGISKCGATIEWDLYYFACTEWTEPTGTFTPHEDEDITVTWEPIDLVARMCLTGEITEERSAMRIIQYLYNRKLFIPCNSNV